MKKYVVVPLGEIIDRGYDGSKIENAFKKFSCQREEDLENLLESQNCYVCLYDRYNDKVITTVDEYDNNSLTQKIMFVYEKDTGTYICIHETM